MKLDYTSIGERIRRARKSKGLTQARLAELSGQEPSNISHIERGATKLSLPTLVGISNALELSPDELLCDSVKAARPILETEMGELIFDCTDDEIRIFTETIRALKSSLRRRG